MNSQGSFFLQAKPVTLKRLEDFDIHDLRNEDASGYNIMLALKGALAETRVLQCESLSPKP